jgi:Predicted phosphatases
MPVIYIDLDGTLLDVWPRYYAVMNKFLERHGLFALSLNEYKRQKLQWIRDEAILRHAAFGYPDGGKGLLPIYRCWKQEALESATMLWLDQPIGRLNEFAAYVGPSYRLHLISIRRDPKLAMRQLRRLNLIAPFERIDFVSPSQTGNPKWEAIRNRTCSQDIMIGDSEIDLACGSMLGLRTFHVRTGLRSFEFASSSYPAYELGQYEEVLDYL